MSRNTETYAPSSFFERAEDLIKPTQGSGVEISLAWKERIIGTYHFHRKGPVSVGSHPDCDITIPIIHSFLDQIRLVDINHQVEVSIPQGLSAELTRVNQEGMEQTYQLNPLEIDRIFLGQKELVKINLGNQMQFLIRPSAASVQPRLIPFLDLGSNGFLSVLFAGVVAMILALFVQLYPSPIDEVSQEEVYAHPLFLQEIQRIARIKMPTKPPKRIDLTKVQKPKSTSISKVKSTPKSNKAGNQTQVAGNKTSAGSLKRNLNKPKRPGANIPKGRSVKTGLKNGAQAKSTNLSQSKLFAAIGNFGKRKNLDKGYDGDGTLAGMANQATGSSGSSFDRPGENFGSRFRESGSSLNGRNNIGVEGLKAGNGLGPGLAQSSLGQRASVEIAPSGTGLVISGQIDREGIRKVFFDNQRAIRSCYERALNQDSTLVGKVILDFDIGPSGRVVGRPKVSRSQSSLFNAEINDCLTNKLKNWVFPDPPSGQVVNVLYPLAFTSR